MIICSCSLTSCYITVSCTNLSDPENGNVTCPSNTSVFLDTCTYYCNRGYQLEGDRQTRCNADGTWSSDPVICTPLKCNDPKVEIANIHLVDECHVTYGSSCLLHCSSGFSVSGNGEHFCDVNDDGTSVKWKSIGGKFTCIDTASKLFTLLWQYHVLLSLCHLGDNKKPTFSTTTIPGAIGGILLLVIIIVFISVALLYNRKSKKSKKRLFNAKLYNCFYQGKYSSYIAI